MKLNVWMKLLWNSWNLCFYACYVLALHPLVDLFIGTKINCLTTLRQLKQEQTEKTTKNLLFPNDNLHAWLFGTACFFDHVRIMENFRRSSQGDLKQNTNKHYPVNYKNKQSWKSWTSWMDIDFWFLLVCSWFVRTPGRSGLDLLDLQELHQTVVRSWSCVM